MKKLLILVAALFVVNIGFSQTSFGVKAGFVNSGLSNLEGNEFISYNRGNGLLLGLMGQFGINEKLSVATELNFIQKGSSSEGNFDFLGVSSEFKNTTTINSIEIPILLRFTAGENLKFYGNVGPYLGYAIGGRIKGENTTGGQTETEKGKIFFKDEPENYSGDDLYIEDGFNRTELGVYFGGGIMKDLGGGSLVIDARFGLGLTDTNDLETEPDGYEPNKFNNIAISIGYLFNLGGE